MIFGRRIEMKFSIESVDVFGKAEELIKKYPCLKKYRF